MKKNIYPIVSMILCSILLGAIFVCNALLSPGMAVIENDLEFIKSGVTNNDVYFTMNDFQNITGAEKIESVTVLSLPDSASGTLKLGDTSIYENQVIGASNFDIFFFRPCTDVSAASHFDLRISTGKENYDVTCEIKMLDHINTAPVAAIDDDSLTIRTKQDVTYYGKLSANDPEGDPLNFTITNTAKHGTVTVTDSIGGSYKYTPANGYTGKDSFTYQVYDEFGNYSDTAKVSITVEKNASGVYYCDMRESWAHNAAITLAEQGIMTGESIGENMLFGPDYRVSRAEFLAMAMDVCKIEADKTLTRTDFTDNDQIPEHLVSYVATAKKMGYISGTETEEGVFFYPNNTITRAEAAVILGKLLDIKVNGTIAVFNDDSSIPVWAQSSMYALSSNGILSGTGMGYASPYTEVTRDQTATMLCAVLEYQK
ncbi:MAG: cadherin-like domain-containing protein [Clostridiales bacterium]|nr:cadherin-like domain-containing protein [Clostridiales bacterium]